MKSLKIILVLFLVNIVFNTRCTKEAGVTGKKTIAGAVLYKNGASGTNDPAISAAVYITYGTNTASGYYDQSTLTDSEGNYSIKGLQKGDYFIRAEYTDSHGFNYTTPGYGVSIKDKKGELKLDIILE